MHTGDSLDLLLRIFCIRVYISLNHLGILWSLWFIFEWMRKITKIGIFLVYNIFDYIFIYIRTYIIILSNINNCACMYAMIMVLWIRYYKNTKIMKTLKYFENYWRFTKMCVRKKWQVFWVKLIGDLEFFLWFLQNDQSSCKKYKSHENVTKVS